MKDHEESDEFSSAINASIDLNEDSGSILDINDKTDIYVEYEKNRNLYLSSGSILTSNRALIQNQRIKVTERSKNISDLQYSRLKRVKYVQYVAMIVFFGVQMLEIPKWWLDNQSIEDKTWWDNVTYPNFDIPKLK